MSPEEFHKDDIPEPQREEASQFSGPCRYHSDPAEEDTGAWEEEDLHSQLSAEWLKQVEEHWRNLPQAYRRSKEDMTDCSFDHALAHMCNLVRASLLETQAITERYQSFLTTLRCAFLVLKAQRHHRCGMHHDSDPGTRAQEFQYARNTLALLPNFFSGYMVTDELLALFPGIELLRDDINRLHDQLYPEKKSNTRE